MMLTRAPIRHRFPVFIISYAIWLYHRFNSSRDVQEQLAFLGMIVSHETIRRWSDKFSTHFKNVIKKRRELYIDNFKWSSQSL